MINHVDARNKCGHDETRGKEKSVIASPERARRSRGSLDCFVAARLAM